MAHDGATLFGRPIDRRELLALTGKVLAGGTVAGMWLSPELAGYVDAAARGEATGGSVTVMTQWSPPGRAPGSPTSTPSPKRPGSRSNLDDQNYNNQYQKITTQGQAGNPTRRRGGDRHDLDRLVRRRGFTLDLTDFLPASVKQQIARLRSTRSPTKARCMRVPDYNSSKHFYYNKKMLAAVGFNRPPTTLDEMIHYCEMLKANKAKLGIQYPMSWSWKQAEALTCDFVQMVDSLGGRFFAPDNVTPAFNKGAGVQALAMMKMMLDKGYAAPGSLTHTETDVENDLLSRQDRHGDQLGRADGPLERPQADGEERTGPDPHGADPRLSGKAAARASAREGWAIMKASKHIPEAKAFVNWWVGKAAQKQAMLFNDQFPIYSAMYSDPQLRKLVQTADGADDFAIYGQQFDYSQARPNFPGYLEPRAAAGAPAQSVPGPGDAAAGPRHRGGGDDQGHGDGGNNP